MTVESIAGAAVYLDTLADSDTHSLDHGWTRHTAATWRRAARDVARISERTMPETAGLLAEWPHPAPNVIVPADYPPVVEPSTPHRHWYWAPNPADVGPEVTSPHSALVSAASRAPMASVSSSRCTYCREAWSIAARTSGSMVEPLRIV